MENCGLGLSEGENLRGISGKIYHRGTEVTEGEGKREEGRGKRIGSLPSAVSYFRQVSSCILGSRMAPASGGDIGNSREQKASPFQPTRMSAVPVPSHFLI